MEEAGERPLALPLPFFLPAWSVVGSWNAVGVGWSDNTALFCSGSIRCTLPPTLAAALHEPLVPRQHVDAGAAQERRLLRRVLEAAVCIARR